MTTIAEYLQAEGYLEADVRDHTARLCSLFQKLQAEIIVADDLRDLYPPGDDNLEEAWELPPGAITLYEIDNIDFWGYVCLFKLKDKFYVGECNASPFMFYTTK